MSNADGSPASYRQVTAVVPAYNEGKAIFDCLSRLRRTYPDLNIIVVNDGSTDNTLSEASRVERVTVLSHRINRGYGAALKTGMRAVKTPITVWFDADSQHDPSALADIVGPVLNNELDANLGMRGKGSAYVVTRMPGKWILRVVAQIVARQRIPDLNCGFRAFRTDIIRRYTHLLPSGFSASATSTILLLKRHYKVGFCPLNTAVRKGGFSTVRILRDGFSTLALILRLMLLFDSFLFFFLCAAAQVVPAVVYSAAVMGRYGRGVPVLGALLIISGILTFFMGVLSAQISEMRQERFEFRPFQE